MRSGPSARYAAMTSVPSTAPLSCDLTDTERTTRGRSARFPVGGEQSQTPVAGPDTMDCGGSELARRGAGGFTRGAEVEPERACGPTDSLRLRRSTTEKGLMTTAVFGGGRVTTPVRRGREPSSECRWRTLGSTNVGDGRVPALGPLGSSRERSGGSCTASGSVGCDLRPPVKMEGRREDRRPDRLLGSAVGELGMLARRRW